MRILLGGLMLLALSSPAFAQPTNPPLRRELARAQFLVGTWEGTAWVKYAPEGARRGARVTAEGRSVLSGVILTWMRVARDGDAVVSNDDVSLRFRRDSSAFRVSVRFPRNTTADGWARVDGCEVSWGFQMTDVPNGDLFRYTVRVDAENRATEVAERSSDGGATWWQFYGAEMRGTSGTGCRPPPAAAGTPAG